MALINNESLAQGTKPDQNQNSLLVIRQFDKLLPGAVTVTSPFSLMGEITVDPKGVLKL